MAGRGGGGAELPVRPGPARGRCRVGGVDAVAPGDRQLVLSLANRRWVREHLNVLISRPTGIGNGPATGDGPLGAIGGTNRGSLHSLVGSVLVRCRRPVALTSRSA